MGKCVEKLNILTSTIKTQKYSCHYNLGKIIVIETINERTIEELAWLPFQKLDHLRIPSSYF